MRISASLPTGVAALLFETARRRREVEGALTERLLGAGFAEVLLPVLDYLEPYEALLTPAGRAELYRFADRDGELLALRADFTPLLARLLAPHLAHPGSLELPLRLFYRGDVVRYQEERAGGEREFYQLGAELLGVAGPAAEREMLSLFLDLLGRAASAPAPLQVVLGFAGALDGLLLAAAGGDGAAAARLAAAVARRERAVVRGVSPALLEVVTDGLPADPAALGADAAPRLRALLALRDELAALHPGLGLTVDLAEFARQTVDPRLAAAVERPYYDGLVFRAHAGPAGLAVGGGGRYDRLFRALGAEVPALGFSLSLDRLTADRLMADRSIAERVDVAQPAEVAR